MFLCVEGDQTWPRFVYFLSSYIQDFLQNESACLRLNYPGNFALRELSLD